MFPPMAVSRAMSPPMAVFPLMDASKATFPLTDVFPLMDVLMQRCHGYSCRWPYYD
jgi:hypothetical protein